VDGAAQHVGVDAAWLGALKPGSRVHLVDARGAQRKFKITACAPDQALAASERTVYLGADSRLHLCRKGHDDLVSPVHDLPQAPGEIALNRGDTLLLLREGLGYAAGAGEGKSRSTRHARIACTLPQALDQARAGERIWFDDGRIGGVVQRRTARGLQVAITRARDGGERLLADKGINLPDTRLDLPALTEKDMQDLDAVVKHADMVGLSFAQGAADVRQLQQGLAERGAASLGLLLKIETRRGFEHLPEMLLAAMASPTAGVMIARGDLAVECGYERLAEVQEEILWACEAAHMPVVWATQVLETLAKTGVPSRAEITDAAMGERAECVMLNKGPHILDAMRTLDDILRRMQSHQSKKRPLLRALKSWTHTAAPDPA
jgi:pyruvate kinase